MHVFVQSWFLDALFPHLPLGDMRAYAATCRAVRRNLLKKTADAIRERVPLLRDEARQRVVDRLLGDKLAVWEASWQECQLACDRCCLSGREAMLNCRHVADTRKKKTGIVILPAGKGPVRLFTLSKPANVALLVEGYRQGAQIDVDGDLSCHGTLEAWDRIRPLFNQPITEVVSDGTSVWSLCTESKWTKICTLKVLEKMGF
jgi:hypothetical protein